MSEYLIQGESMTAIADAIRAKANTTDSMTPEAMAAAIAELKTGLEKIYNLQVGETKTGTFTVSSNTRWGPILTLWPGNPDAIGLGFMVYLKSGFGTSYMSDNRALVSGFYSGCGSVKFGRMNTSGPLAVWGSATYGDSNSSIETDWNFAVVPSSEDQELGTVKPTTRTASALFKAGAVYEWIAWKKKVGT